MLALLVLNFKRVQLYVRVPSVNPFWIEKDSARIHEHKVTVKRLYISRSDKGSSVTKAMCDTDIE